MLIAKKKFKIFSLILVVKLLHINMWFLFFIFVAMKKNYLLWVAALSAVVLLAGCGTKELTPTEFCEENGGVSQEGICLFEDGSYCAEEAFQSGECKAGEMILNPIEEEVAEPEVVEEEVAEPEVVEEEVAEPEVVEEVTGEVAE